MIALPVRVDSASDAFFIVDAKGKVIADCIARKEWAEQICQALNKTKGQKDE